MQNNITARDWGIVLGKGLVSTIPFVGSLLSEAIGVLIPNQRLDRLEQLIIELEKKIAHIEPERVEHRFRDPQFIDILEEGIQQAARAFEPNRIEHIAILLKNSISDEEIQRLRDKRLLGLLSELNDIEIIILTSYIHRGWNSEFHKQHSDILSKPLLYAGSSQAEIEAAAIANEYRNHLVRLDLLKNRYKTPKRGESPDFDKETGTIKASGHEITQLGKLLLRRLDILKSNED